jgi:hypothetical protein
MSTETFSEKGDSSSKQSGGVDWYSNPNASLAKVWAKEDYGEVCFYLSDALNPSTCLTLPFSI